MATTESACCQLFRCGVKQPMVSRTSLRWIREDSVSGDLRALGVAELPLDAGSVSLSGSQRSLGVVNADVHGVRFELLGLEENRAGAAERIQDNLPRFDAGQVSHGGRDWWVQAAWDGVLSPRASVERHRERPDADVDRFAVEYDSPVGPAFWWRARTA